MAVRLRAFQETDYPVLTALYNRCRPDVPETEATLRAAGEAFSDDEQLNLVAEVTNGELVGAAWAHTADSGKDQVRFDILALVSPGLAETLYGVVLERFTPQTSALLVRVRENWTDLGFYTQRGFKEYERMWESRLALSTFEPAPFARISERSDQTPVRICTLADMPKTEAVQRRLYDAVVELLGDVPFSEPRNIWPFEVWQRRFWQHPSRRPESFFLALEGDEIVGVSELRSGAQPDWLYTGLTGVKPAYRRRGIALALKLSALRHAKGAGFTIVSTQNHVGNRPMLSINEALGFVKEPAWIRLKKEL